MKPELVAPAGNLEKLYVAYLYGADAAYIGTNIFGLRKYADNFNLDDLKKACVLAKNLNKKLYLVINGFAHNADLKDIIFLLKKINKLYLSGLVISDLGVFNLAKKYTTFPLHISTQSSVLNTSAAKFWQNLGAKRIVLAREISLKEAIKIKKATGLEIEVFVHGARCAGYSGACVISNYTSARDSNRGGCVQNCRHLLNLYDAKKQKIASGYFMNSKDLMTIEKIPELIKSGITALKIEGRMKSALYVANTVKIYRQALDNYAKKNKARVKDETKNFTAELDKISNRTFSLGGLFSDSTSPVNNTNQSYYNSVEFIGLIKNLFENDTILLDVKNPFSLGEELEYLSPSGKVIPFTPNEIFDLNNEPLLKTRVNQLVKITGLKNAKRFGIVRKAL